MTTLARYAASYGNSVLVLLVVSSRRLESNGVQERVEVGDDALIQPVESMAFLLSETSIGGDRREEAGGERGVNAFEELQEDEADYIALREVEMSFTG
jgi:hypothetical protein